MAKPKAIRMFTLVNGERAEVGTCHPGQARVLRKQGVADWDKDGLLLHLFSGTPVGAVAQTPEAWEGDVPYPIDHTLVSGMPAELVGLWSTDLDSEDVGVEVAANIFRDEGGRTDSTVMGAASLGIRMPEVKIHNTDHRHQIHEEEEHEIDPDRLLRSPQKLPTEVSVRCVREFFEESVARRNSGHTLYSCDDPKSLRLGVVDDDANELLSAPLRWFKALTEADVASLGMPASLVMEKMRHVLGRQEVLSTDGFFSYEDGDTSSLDGVVWGWDDKPEVRAMYDAVFNKKPEAVDPATLRYVPPAPPGWAKFTLPADRDRLRVASLDPAYVGRGYYRRVKGRLYLVWTEPHVSWACAELDEVTMNYATMLSETRLLDPIYEVGTGDRVLEAVPRSFGERVLEAEANIAAFLAEESK